MKLSVFERMILLNTLPAEGDLTTLKIVRGLRESLSFTEEEHAALNIRIGQDWSRCPNCGGEAIEWTRGKNNPDRRCITCSYEGADGAGKIFWNQSAPQEADLEIGVKASKIVKEALDKLNKERKLTDAHLTLCEKFGLASEE